MTHRYQHRHTSFSASVVATNTVQVLGPYNRDFACCVRIESCFKTHQIRSAIAGLRLGYLGMVEGARADWCSTLILRWSVGDFQAPSTSSAADELMHGTGSPLVVRFYTKVQTPLSWGLPAYLWRLIIRLGTLAGSSPSRPDEGIGGFAASTEGEEFRIRGYLSRPRASVCAGGSGLHLSRRWPDIVVMRYIVVAAGMVLLNCCAWITEAPWNISVGKTFLFGVFWRTTS